MGGASASLGVLVVSRRIALRVFPILVALVMIIAPPGTVGK